MITKHMGLALRCLRRRQGRIQKEVAEAAGVSKNLLSNWETGTTQPSWESLAKILRTLGNDLLDLHLAIQSVGGSKAWIVEPQPERHRETDFSRLGSAVRLLRGRFGLSQKALAEAAGISKNLLSNWETGTTRPSLLSLAKILAVFNVDLLVLHNTLCLLNGKPAVRLGARPPIPPAVGSPPVALCIPEEDRGWFLAQTPQVLRWLSQLQALLLRPEDLERLSRGLGEGRDG